MPFLKMLINGLLSGTSAFCTFCLKIIGRNEENTYSFNDVFTLENNVSISIVDILTSVIGSNYINCCMSRILCHECTTKILQSYKFIEMCKKNTQQMYNIVLCLETCLDSDINTEKTEFCKSLFITINTDTESSQMQYDTEECTDMSVALDRLQYLAHNQCNILNSKLLKQELLPNVESFDASFADIQEMPIVLKQCKKRKTIKKIPLNEIIHDMNNTSILKCKICFNVYSNMYRLRQHFQRVHAPKEFNCTKCSRSYGSPALLTQHNYDSHSSLICSDCGKSYSCRSTFKTHMQSHNLKLICQVCGKLFKNKRNFNNHMKLNICNSTLRKVNLDKKFVCDYCSKRYSSKCTLRSHITFEHGNGSVHICSWCNKKFNAVSRLNAHIVTHTQEKKFGCDICGGRFVTKESLRYHTRIHTGERPYQCEYCEQKFLSTSRRAEHVRRHHKEPIVDCDICHSKFRSHSCLKRHKSRHFNPNSRLHYTRLVDTEDKEM